MDLVGAADAVAVWRRLRELNASARIVGVPAPLAARMRPAAETLSRCAAAQTGNLCAPEFSHIPARSPVTEQRLTASYHCILILY